jgi:hypothetical protein
MLEEKEVMPSVSGDARKKDDDPSLYLKIQGRKNPRNLSSRSNEQRGAGSETPGAYLL